MLAPSSPPSEIVQKLNKAMNAVRELPEMKEAILKHFGNPDRAGGSPERWADLINSDTLLQPSRVGRCTHDGLRNI